MLYWCARTAGGLSTAVDSGCTIDDAVAAAKYAGAVDEADDPYPIGASDLFAVPPRPDQFEAASPYRLRGAATCFGVGGARRALSHGHPVACGVILFPAARSPDAAETGRLEGPARGEHPIGGHALCLIYDDLAAGEIWALNSWGPAWGAEHGGRRGWAILRYDYLARYGAEYRALIAA